MRVWIDAMRKVGVKMMNGGIIIRIRINAQWSIDIYPSKSCNNYISGWIDGQIRNYSFIKHDKMLKQGKIAYDFPECVPEYVKNYLRIALNKIINMKFVQY